MMNKKTEALMKTLTTEEVSSYPNVVSSISGLP